MEYVDLINHAYSNKFNWLQRFSIFKIKQKENGELKYRCINISIVILL